MSSLKELKGKVALVTGGASGIGRGIATQLLAEGMTVVIADVETVALEEAAADLGVVGIQTDVSDLQSVQALADDVVSRFGTVHVVCNNAGIGGRARIADMAMSDWRWSLGVNLWGVINGVHVFLPILAANEDGGHIVNTSSMGGLRTRPGMGAYAVGKFGVVALSEVLASELAEENSNVGVSVFCPGPVRTNLGRFIRNVPSLFADGQFGNPDVAARASTATFRAPPLQLEPTEAGTLVVNAIKQGDLYVLTDPGMYPEVEERHQQIALAFEQAASRPPIRLDS